jgi:hypothetical protein
MTLHVLYSPANSEFVLGADGKVIPDPQTLH